MSLCKIKYANVFRLSFIILCVDLHTLHSLMRQKIVLNNSSQNLIIPHPSCYELQHMRNIPKKDNSKLLHLLHTVGIQRLESNFHLFNTENVK